MTQSNSMQQEDDDPHATIMKRFTEPHNPANVLLHEKWQPWAERARYIGSRIQFHEKDYMKNFRYGCNLRMHAIAKHSYAIPSEEALHTIARVSNSRVVEVGSGTGYWARLLHLHGVDVVAVDTGREFPDAQWWPWPSTVKMDGVKYLEQNDGCRDRALFLCWPRSTAEILAAYRGNTVIWVGEINGCTAMVVDDDDDNDTVEWTVVDKVLIPTWPGIHDVMHVYTRVQ